MPDPLADYTVVVDLEPLDRMYDMQGHLNNAAIVELFSNLRVAYMREKGGFNGRRRMVPDGVVVGVRQMFVSYESEGMPGDRYRGGVRVLGRSRRAYLFDECIAAGERVIARQRVVEVVIDSAQGKAIEIPDLLWSFIEEAEGRAMPPGPLPVPRLDWT